MKEPISYQVTFMFCCGLSLGVDRPGRPMAVINDINGLSLKKKGIKSNPNF